MKTKKELVEWCESKLGTPYVYGAKGKRLTENQIISWALLYPNVYTASYKAKARTFIDQYCTDCSGLISWLTGTLRGSYQYYETAVSRVAISKLNESMIGWAVWKSGHIGVYVGNGYCIEAKGINHGTVKTKVSATAWTHVLKLCDIDYTEIQVTKKSGWEDEGDGTWRYYNGDTGLYVCNDWVQDLEDGKWYWFDGDGKMIRNTWYEYKDKWYRLGSDGAMVTGLQDAAGKWYYLDQEGQMATEPVVFVPDASGALQYPNLLND